MADYKYISDRCSDGVIVGYNASDLISFYGATPISQRSGATQAAVAVSTITTAAITTTTNAYGYATTTQADNIAATAANCVTLINEIRTVLVNLGFMKGSA